MLKFTDMDICRLHEFVSAKKCCSKGRSRAARSNQIQVRRVIGWLMGFHDIRAFSHSYDFFSEA